MELAASVCAPGSSRGRNGAALGRGVGIDTTRSMSASARAGQTEQVQLHRDHDLALDQQVDIEGQRVEGDVDRALDRVLDGDEAEVDLAGLGGQEHVG